MFNTIEETLDWLYNQKKLSKRENLKRIEQAAKALGITKSYPIIHIAGTNGKGSTASYLKNILKLTGRHVGFFVSPFVVCFNERIQINDRYISDAEIMHYANILYSFANKYFEQTGDVIPFFELTLLMALLFFKDRSIDIAIIECGMGGLLDATNFLETDLAIITNIGYDHMNTLGNSLEEISYHKLGIAKKNMTCLTCVCNDLKPLFNSYAKAHQVKMIFVDKEVRNIALDGKTHFIYKNNKYTANMQAKYQAYNASLAIEAANYIDASIPLDIIQYGLEITQWPGRMEVLSKNPYILLDGAHNIHGIEALVDTIREIRNGRKIKIIFSALHDKDFNKMLNKLDEIVDLYYFTSMKDLRATNPLEFINFTSKPYKVIENYSDCLDEAIREVEDNEILIVTGSLHFISCIRKYYLEKNKDEI